HQRGPLDSEPGQHLCHVARVAVRPVLLARRVPEPPVVDPDHLEPRGYRVPVRVPHAGVGSAPRHQHHLLALARPPGPDRLRPSTASRTPSPMRTAQDTCSSRRLTAGRPSRSLARATVHTSTPYQSRSTSTQRSARVSRVSGTFAPCGTNCGRNDIANTPTFGFAAHVPSPAR